MDWRRGAAGPLHARPLPTDGRRRVSVLEVDRPALVLGSTSPDVEPAGSGFDVVRRTSGGGLVWLDPAESTWLDVFVPADDPLSERDVARAFAWLGERISLAFVSLGVPAAAATSTASGPSGRAGRDLLCFGSVGHGEVVVVPEPDGPAVEGTRKLVGISQRRTRAGSRFQCVWYRHF
ncbi:MAG TPA: hypothetical protein DEP69_00530, partial [Acidimicrobiaceae bacterium]|nr:hypothetical protein [Acidimicrobiaceae bacterium]